MGAFNIFVTSRSLRLISARKGKNIEVAPYKAGLAELLSDAPGLSSQWPMA